MTPSCRVPTGESVGVCNEPRRLELVADLHTDTAGVDYAVAADGSFFVLGAFRGAATFGAAGGHATSLRSWSATMTDIFLAKYTATGALVFARRAGGRRMDEPSKVVALRDGGALISGSYFDEARFGRVEKSEATLAPGADLHASFVARYDAQGHVVWARRLEGAEIPSSGGADVEEDRVFDQSVVGLASDGSGAATVVGAFRGELHFDDAPTSTLQARGKTDAFVVRFDANGTLQWAHALGGDGDVTARAVAVMGEDALVAGKFSGTARFDGGPFRLEATRSTDGFIARYAGDGSLRWARALEGDGSDDAHAVAVDAAGVAWVVAQIDCNESTDAGLRPFGHAELFVASFDETGTACSREQLTR